MMLIAMLLLLLAGCESYRRLVYANPSIAGAKEGQDCRSLVLRLGDTPDLSGSQAVRLGGITKTRSIEYRRNTFQSVGSECLIAYRE